MAKFRKYIKTDTVASSGGKCFKKLQKGQINPDAGLYDDNDVLLASWEDLVYKYGLKDAGLTAWSSTPSPGSALYIFSNNEELASGTKLIIDGDTYSKRKLFEGLHENTYSYCENLKSVIISNGITKIGDRMFRGCTNLKSIIIPDSVTSIGEIAFAGCSALEHINIPATVTSFYSGMGGSGAFSKCISLKSITIPDGFYDIPWRAFEFCTSLTAISIPDSIWEIGPSAFEGCTALKDVYFRGTEERWGKITIERDNECLTNATIHYNSQ